jgi:hypothetical protein
MRIGIGTLVVMSASALAVLVIILGPLALAYVAAFAGMGLMAGVMGYSAFVALRNWQLEKLPGLRAPRWWDGKRA